MNNRLLELVQEAEQSANLGNAIDVKLMMQNYAELIIKECIKSVEEMFSKPGSLCTDDWWKGYDARGADTIEIIKEHFGIE